MGDALALGGEEGRDKLRKAAGSGKYTEIRGCPNGATRPASSRAHAKRGRTQGTETSQYLQEEKIIMIPRVAASESGRAQTGRVATPLRGNRTANTQTRKLAEPAGKRGRRG